MRDQKNPSEDHGRLRTGFTRARRVDVWTFQSPIQKGNLEQLSVEVYIERAEKASYQGRPTFSARGKMLPGFRFTDSDVGRLYDRVEEQLRKNDLARSGLEWEEWMEVTVDGFVADYESGSTLGISFEYLKRAVDPKTGKAMTIHSNNVVIPFPKSKRAGEKDEEDYHHENIQVAYVPATPENVAAIKAVCERLDELRGTLNELLAQDRIVEALTLPWTRGRLALASATDG